MSGVNDIVRNVQCGASHFQKNFFNGRKSFLTVVNIAFG